MAQDSGGGGSASRKGPGAKPGARPTGGGGDWAHRAAGQIAARRGMGGGSTHTSGKRGSGGGSGEPWADQPRVPKGKSTGGQWTSGGGGSSSEEAKDEKKAPRPSLGQTDADLTAALRGDGDHQKAIDAWIAALRAPSTNGTPSKYDDDVIEKRLREGMRRLLAKDRDEPITAADISRVRSAALRGPLEDEKPDQPDKPDKPDTDQPETGEQDEPGRAPRRDATDEYKVPKWVLALEALVGRRGVASG